MWWTQQPKIPWTDKALASDQSTSSGLSLREANASRASPTDSDPNDSKPTLLLLLSEETPGGTPDIRVNTPVPIPTGADPLPNSNGAVVEIEPPPAIEGMPPLSGAAMSSFASAAKGVTTKQEMEELDNKQGLIVLNGSK